MPMYNPPHPGEMILDLCIEPTGQTIASAAKHLGVSRKHLSAVINGRSRITANLAIRLAQAYGSSPEVSLRMQAAYDLWQAQQKEDIHVPPVPRVA